MSMTDNAQTTDTYTASGGTLTYSDGSGVEYCVSGKNLTVRPPVGSGGVAMQFKLHRT